MNNPDLTPTVFSPRISSDPRHVLVPGQWLTLTNVVTRAQLAAITAEDMWFRCAPHVDLDYGPLLDAEFRNLTDTVEIRHQAPGVAGQAVAL